MQWLRYCLSIGYEAKDLSVLRDIWFKYKDDKGNLKGKDAS